jgi:ABC-type antimicrobial peptide transport system permease subunit
MTSIKFKSTKDVFFQALVLGIVGGCIGLIVSVGLATGLDKSSYVTISLLLLVSAFLLWSYYGTYYELAQKQIKYNCGPIKGKIEIKEIREVIKGKTLWVGLKPATARKGLIIKYGKFDEIYISPQTNDEFINRLLELNDAIKITS